ncbi:MAG: hypothetical protein ACTSVI_05625 [Promethearchaeota archaeon]
MFKQFLLKARVNGLEVELLEKPISDFVCVSLLVRLINHEVGSTFGVKYG